MTSSMNSNTSSMSWLAEPPHNGMKLGEFLRSTQGFSRRLLKAAKQEGCLHVNGEAVNVLHRLAAGDRVELFLPGETVGLWMEPEEMALSICYEDEAIIVLDKPAGIASIPSRDHPSGTIANGLLGHYKKLGLSHTVHVVTRLDRDTSGLMLIAKHRYAHSLLSVSQKAQEIHRYYIAAAEGHLPEENGTICLPIGRKEGSIIERAVTPAGKSAVTRYAVMRRFAGGTLLRVRLETGRTHQIRVHFSHIGHPLFGDRLYGGSAEQISRQALHCAGLSFVHPFTKKELTFTSKLPEDMELFNLENE